MTGADEAHRNQANAQASRTLLFPDGLVRHITLTNWQWDVADWLQREAGWSPEAVPRIAYEMTQKFWVIAVFNEAAGVPPTDPAELFSCNADEISFARRLSWDRTRFENQLRRCVESVIRVNMHLCAGHDTSPSNDE